MNWLILLFVSATVPVSLTLTLLHLDPIYLITRELILPKSVNSNNLNNVSIKILSLIVVPSISCILLKVMFIFVYVLTLLFSHLKNYACALNKVHNLPKCLQLKYYIECRVFMLILKQLISELTIIFIIGGQFVLTMFSWVAINCAQILPKFVILCSATTVIGGLALWITILRFALYVTVYSEQLIFNKRNEFLNYNKYKFRHYFALKWRAQNELKVSCGHHFAITKDAVNIFISVLNTNITDAILLIVP